MRNKELNSRSYNNLSYYRKNIKVGERREVGGERVKRRIGEGMGRGRIRRNMLAKSSLNFCCLRVKVRFLFDTG